MADIDSIELLRRQYLQLLDPDELALPNPELLRLPSTQSRMYDRMFNEAKKVYPPPERYKFRVLKRLVGALEQAIEDPEEDDISNDISECLAQYMSHPLPSVSAAAQQKGYVTYTVPSSDLQCLHVTTLEARSLLASSGTTGFRTWEAALHLGYFLCSVEGAKYVAYKDVLELGAGTGFLSVLCARHLGATSVLATDGSQEVISDLKTNVSLNGLSDNERVKTSVLQWGHTLIGGVADCRAKGRSYDLVIGADVVSDAFISPRILPRNITENTVKATPTYDVHSMPALVATIRNLFGLYPRIKVLISATVRNEETLTAFLNACDINDFATEKLNNNVPSSSKQIGFFHPTTTSINVYLITNVGSAEDPFAS